MIDVQGHIDLSLYTSFRIGGMARAFAILSKEDDILEALECASSRALPFHVLGGGTNAIFKDASFEGFVGKIELKGLKIESDDRDASALRVSAGEKWDDAVAFAASRGLSGIEALSAIPGTAGATPVQNVGAYGQEIADTLIELRAYDILSKSFVTIPTEKCGFSYRKSIFNSCARGRFIITSILLKLSKLPAKVPEYPGVAEYFEEKGIFNPSLSQIREAIISIRAAKLPDPSVIPNAGSFFKNPIVQRLEYEKLASRFPSLPHFETKNGIKIPAGWLIEQAELKGKAFGPISSYEKNAVVLANTGAATFADLQDAEQEIIAKIRGLFGIELEREPNFI